MTTGPRSAGHLPELTISFGGLSAAVWTDEYDRDGVPFTKHSIKLSRSYKDGDGNWQQTPYFDRRDLGALLTIILELNQRLNLRVVDHIDDKHGGQQ